MEKMDVLKEDQFSKVWREGDWVYKRQHEFMTDNEYWFLCQMFPSGYVPDVEKLDKDLIRTKFIKKIPIMAGYKKELLDHVPKILKALKERGIRHGDLTRYALIIGEYGWPYLIDFSESRLWDDPRPSKRPEGDTYWLHKTVREMLNLNPITADFLSSGKS